jgi:hypothetical protein
MVRVLAIATDYKMKAIHKRLEKLEAYRAAEIARQAPRISDLIRRGRFDAVRAAQGLPPLAPQLDTQHLSIAEIIRSRRAKWAQHERSEIDKQTTAEG